MRKSGNARYFEHSLTHMVLDKTDNAGKNDFPVIVHSLFAPNCLIVVDFSLHVEYGTLPPAEGSSSNPNRVFQMRLKKSRHLQLPRHVAHERLSLI